MHPWATTDFGDTSYVGVFCFSSFAFFLRCRCTHFVILFSLKMHDLQSITPTAVLFYRKTDSEDIQHK